MTYYTLQWEDEDSPRRVDVDKFIEVNEFTPEEEERIRNLKVGEEMHFGGGAFCFSTLTVRKEA